MCAQKNKKKSTIASGIAADPTKINEINETKINDDNVAVKEEILRWLFSIIGAMLVYLVIANIVLSVYHPDINALLTLANKIGATGLAAPRPEPVEALLFRVGIITILSCFAAFYALFSKTNLVKGLAQKPFFIVFSTLCALVIVYLIYIDFAAQNPFANGGGDQPQNSRDYVGKSNFDFYFDGLFLSSNLLLYTCFLVPLTGCIFYLGFRKYNWETNKLFNLITSGIGYIVLGGTVLAIVLMNIYEFPYAFENKYDFNALYYSITQVYAGSPMLVDGFTNTYGLYPEFLNPLFHLTGLDIFKVSLTMSLLTGLCFVLNFCFLKKVVANKVILFLGFATVIFFPYLDVKFLTGFDSSFAFFPIRYIIPSSLTFLASLYFFKRSAKIYWSIFILMSFAVLWNPEIGLVSFLAWLAAITYSDFYSSNGKVAFKKIFFHWVAGISILIATILFYKGVIYICYGAQPNIRLLFAAILDFEKIGLGLLPMPLVHPWNLEALILLFGFIYAIVKWYKKEITPKSSVILLTSVLGLGFLVYYQGRSHNWQFSVSSGFSLALLTILGDELWAIVKRYNVLALHILFAIFLFLISVSFFGIITNTSKINEIVYQDEDKEKQRDEEARIKSNTEFILKNSKEKEKIFVLSATQYEGLYFDGNKRVSAFNPGVEDLFLTADLERMAKIARDSSYSIFIEPELSKNPVMARILPDIAATYELTAVNQTMALLRKRATKIPEKSFFPDSGQVVMHRKYSEDTAGLNLRVGDAFGIAPVSLNSEFSIEILFNARTQIYQFATLIGNMDDSSGFLIGAVMGSPNYFVGVNGKGFNVPMPNNEWVYCVLNVYHDHLELYENGILSGNYPIAQPVKSSPEKLYIGNLGYWRNYIGLISEVSVINKTIDKNQVAATWENIKGTIAK